MDRRPALRGGGRWWRLPDPTRGVATAATPLQIYDFRAVPCGGRLPRTRLGRQVCQIVCKSRLVMAAALERLLMTERRKLSIRYRKVARRAAARPEKVPLATSASSEVAHTLLHRCWTKHAPIPAGVGQHLPSSDQFRPTLVDLGEALANLGQLRSIWANTCRSPN